MYFYYYILFRGFHFIFRVLVSLPYHTLLLEIFTIYLHFQEIHVSLFLMVLHIV